MLYVNASIHTMDAENPVASAFLVEKGRFRLVGGDELLSHPATDGAVRVDLNHHSVVPGFIDAHSHFPGSGLRALGPELRGQPLGSVNSIEALLSVLETEHQRLEKGRWLLGFNYDNTVFPNGAHPTKSQLDSISKTRPIYLWHHSGHMGVANSAALASLGYNNSSMPPVGGTLGRDKQTRELNGLLQERAAPPMRDLLKTAPILDLFEVIEIAAQEYLSVGVTTVQDGFSGAAQMRAWRLAQGLNLIPQRLVVWPAHEKWGGSLLEEPIEQISADQFSIGPVKLIADGSPQGLTAYLTQPYHAPLLNQLPRDYRGYPARAFSVLATLVEQYHRAGFDLALHGNGDAAIDDILSALEQAQQDYPRADARHLVVHAQTVRQDQLEKMARLNVSASFFITHTFYFGDWHAKRSLGPERAGNISPTGWADAAGLKYSLHSDAPVTPMRPMELLWSASERLTSSGRLLGSDQRISVARALRAITIDAAWQSRLEASRGSIEPGKLADFVVLSDDPYTSADVRNIDVLATVIGGVVRYRQPEAADVKFVQ